jgi:hypothetical protein
VGSSKVAHGFLFGESHGHERCSWLLFFEGAVGTFPIALSRLKKFGKEDELIEKALLRR